MCPRKILYLSISSGRSRTPISSILTSWTGTLSSLSTSEMCVSYQHMMLKFLRQEISGQGWDLSLCQERCSTRSPSAWFRRRCLYLYPTKSTSLLCVDDWFQYSRDSGALRFHSTWRTTLEHLSHDQGSRPWSQWVRVSTSMYHFMIFLVSSTSLNVDMVREQGRHKSSYVHCSP